MPGSTARRTPRRASALMVPRLACGRLAGQPVSRLPRPRNLARRTRAVGRCPGATCGACSLARTRTGCHSRPMDTDAEKARRATEPSRDRGASARPLRRKARRVRTFPRHSARMPCTRGRAADLSAIGRSDHRHRGGEADEHVRRCTAAGRRGLPARRRRCSRGRCSREWLSRTGRTPIRNSRSSGFRKHGRHGQLLWGDAFEKAEPADPRTIDAGTERSARNSRTSSKIRVRTCGPDTGACTL